MKKRGQNPSFLISSDKVNETQRKSLGFGKYVPEEKQPNAAQPRTMSFKESRNFDPSKDLVSRIGIVRL